MRILALDTAMNACSVAVVEVADGDGRIASTITQAMERGHAEALLPMVELALAQAGCGFGDLDRIAVTVGPGTFTGTRIGISAARGYALANDIPVVGVSTLQAVAMNVPMAEDAARDLVVAFDAHRGEVYIQRFTAIGRIGLGEPQVLPLADAVLLLAPGPVALVGSGAQLLLDLIDGDRKFDVEPIEASSLPDPVWVARLAARSTLQPVPLYLRPPDAKPQAQQILRAG